MYTNPYLEKTQKNKERIVLEHASTVKKIANRLIARLPSEVHIDDLIQAGMIGLMEAIERYDPTRANQFKTFAEFRIRGAMLDELRAKDWIPRSVRESSTKLEKAYTALRHEGYDYPTNRQLAKELGIKLEELEHFLNKAKPITLLSVEGFQELNKNENKLDLLETLPDPEAKDPVELLLGSEIQTKLAEKIQKLPKKEQLVLSLYYQEDLNLKEIAAVLEVTESRISQLRTKAIGMLRSLLQEDIQKNINTENYYAPSSTSL